jgi:hypothetical protein
MIAPTIAPIGVPPPLLMLGTDAVLSVKRVNDIIIHSQVIWVPPTA